MSVLRSKGFENVAYIDDAYLKGNTFSDCETNISTIVRLFTDLGATLNMAKSVLIPSQVITLISGLCILFCSNDGISNTFQILEIKIKSNIDLLDNQSPTIRIVAEVISLMVASFPGVMYGPLYYRQLEIEKVAALKQSKGSFDSVMNFSDKARSDLQWWIENITTTSNTVTDGNPQVTIYSDASLTN